MDMKGEYRIEAPRQTVWEALNDPEVLKQTIPGCEEIVKSSDTEMTAKVTAKVGPVKAKFQGNVTLSDLNPPESYTISGEGKGGAAGFAKGGAKVHLAEDGGATVLTYEVNANVGGKLAQLGSRLIDGTAKKMADDFFGNFARHVGGPPVAAEPAAAAAPTAAAAPPPSEAPKPARGLSPVTWVSGLIVLVLLLLLIFQFA
ncbi:MAG: carbon monoxide dehydrogenase subunit G [Inquilinus sp.]|nr:carbon monoxide dehydrogenase subunit G [Inquilinus sp.]